MNIITGEDREIIEGRLKSLLADGGGRLTPERVVADARAVDSPLHRLFDWNDSSAAHKHRLDTARAVIGSIQLIVKTEHVVLRVPGYVRDPSCAGREQGYVETASLRNEEDAARQVLLTEFQRAGACLARARALAVVLNLEPEIDALCAGISALRERMAQAPAAVQ
jgi:hypothetical protein